MTAVSATLPEWLCAACVAGQHNSSSDSAGLYGAVNVAYATPLCQLWSELGGFGQCFHDLLVASVSSLCVVALVLHSIAQCSRRQRRCRCAALRQEPPQQHQRIRRPHRGAGLPTELSDVLLDAPEPARPNAASGDENLSRPQSTPHPRRPLNSLQHMDLRGGGGGGGGCGRAPAPACFTVTAVARMTMLVARSGAALWALFLADVAGAITPAAEPAWATAAAGVSAAAFLLAAALGAGGDLCLGRPTQHGAVTALVLAFFVLDAMCVLAGLFALTELAAPGAGGGGNHNPTASPAAPPGAAQKELLSPASLTALAVDIVLVAMSAVEFRTARWPWEIAAAAAAEAGEGLLGPGERWGAVPASGDHDDAGGGSRSNRRRRLLPPALSPPDNAPFFMRISFFWVWPLIRRAYVLVCGGRSQLMASSCSLPFRSFVISRRAPLPQSTGRRSWHLARFLLMTLYSFASSAARVSSITHAIMHSVVASPILTSHPFLL